MKGDLLSFRYDGRDQWYDQFWLHRFKNPHGHYIFSEEDMEELGGNYADCEYAFSDEQLQMIDKRIESYRMKLENDASASRVAKRQRKEN